MFINRIKSVLRSNRPSRRPVATSDDESHRRVSEDDWIEFTKSMTASYPRLFLGISLITGASIGWIIKRR